jgi:plastocyanin
MTLLQRTCLAVFAVSFALPVAAIGPSPVPESGSASQQITGTILVKKKLTKPSVTAPVSIYQRGAAVELGKDAAEDPLAYERSRVVVYLEGPATPEAVPARLAPLTMQQQNRRFTPDLLVVPVGGVVSFPNMDPIFHNIFSLSKPKTFDLGSYNKGESRSVTFTKPGVVYVYCHLHPNMEATIVVTPNRYFARVDPSGQFHIPNVPPGQYTVVAWHKAAGFFRKTIEIQPGHNAAVDFFIPISDDAQQKVAMKSMDGMEDR